MKYCGGAKGRRYYYVIKWMERAGRTKKKEREEKGKRTVQTC
jgi:hypothetical protein